MFDPKPQWMFDNPAASAERFRNLAAQATDPIEQALWQTQLARALGLSGDFNAGHELLDDVDETEATDELLAWSAIERGRLYRSDAKTSLAYGYFEIASKLSMTQGLDALRIDALHMLALCLKGEEQIVMTKKAIAETLASEQSAARKWLGSLYNNLGVAYGDAGEWHLAREAFDTALAAQLEVGDVERIFIAKYMVGWAMRNQGHLESALEHMTALKAELSAAGKSDQYVNAELELLQASDQQ